MEQRQLGWRLVRHSSKEQSVEHSEGLAFRVFMFAERGLERGVVTRWRLQIIVRTSITPEQPNT